MAVPILATKLYVPLPRSKVVLRTRLISRLNESMQSKLTLVSASAGFGKTTLVSEWADQCVHPVTWLSLDKEHSDYVCFLTYLITALQKIKADIGEGVLKVLQSPQLPPVKSILISLLNEITTIPDSFVLVLDDYHLTDSKEVDNVLTFLLEHIPPKMHLVIATREDPHLPLARLRGQGQLTELRVIDLRFTSSESVEFLDRVMGLEISSENIMLLTMRTEGWVAGLQLAAISMQRNEDTSGFIDSFTGSHHFVLDYLIEEVLNQQSESVQIFLLCTSILDRMCGSLCDSVLLSSSSSGQETLEFLEQSNMFIIPLDNERHWFRYHHLFAELLRHRLSQSDVLLRGDRSVTELHICASEWYENNGLGMEAFHHSAAANDIDRSLRLIEEKGVAIHSHGAVASVLNWLKSLPKTVMDKNPLLWISYASVSLGFGQISGVEQKLKAAEAALEDVGSNENSRDMTGRIATMRAILGVTQYDTETMKTQSLRALEYLHPENLSSRTTAAWTLGQAYEQSGDHSAARNTYNDALSIGQTSGNVVFTILAMEGLGYMEEVENKLHLAVQTYQKILKLVGDQPLPVLSDVYLGLARIFYQWNDMDSALQYANSSIELARLFENTIDRFIVCEIFLSNLKLASGDIDAAASLLAETSRSVQQNNFIHRIPEVSAQQVLTLIKQGDLEAAAEIADKHKLPISQARIYLASGNASGALAILEPLDQKLEGRDWDHEKLNVMVVKSIALNIQGEKDEAFQVLVSVLTLTEPEGFIRIFIDEGFPMFRLLSEAAAKGIMPDYTKKLVAVFKAEKQQNENLQPLIEPLSQRELEVLQLLAQGLSNNEICEKLFLALDTVKGHNRRIFSKLDVKNRSMAIAKARSLHILNP